MNYYLRKTSGAPIEGPHDGETLRAMLDTDPRLRDWQITGDIGERREQVERSPDDDWFPLHEAVFSLPNPIALPNPTAVRAVVANREPERPVSPRSPRSYTPEETRLLQELCRQRRKSAERRKQVARVAHLVSCLLYFGCMIASGYASGSPGAAATLKMWLPYLAILFLVTMSGMLPFDRVRCPGCLAALPQNPARDPINDNCDECGLQLTAVTGEPAPSPRTCSNEEAGRLQQAFTTRRRKASAAHVAGFTLFLVGGGLLIAPATLHPGTIPGLVAVNAILILGSVICWGVGYCLLYAPWRVRCPACCEQLLANSIARVWFCHFCARPIRETAKGEGHKRVFHFECACRPGVSQGTGRDGLSHLCHCPHCGVKLI